LSTIPKFSLRAKHKQWKRSWTKPDKFLDTLFIMGIAI